MATFVGILMACFVIVAGVGYIYIWDATRPKPDKTGEWYDGDNWPRGEP
jgi:hypothetical protein